jgi:uncharacterized protein (DUF362 family)
VLIKPNDVNPGSQLACTHADALHGILDYLAPRSKGQVTTGETLRGGFKAFQGLQYPEATQEYTRFRVGESADFTEQNEWVTQPLVDQDAHVVPVRLAAELFDPDAYVIGTAMLKSHNYAVATNFIAGGRPPPRGFHGIFRILSLSFRIFGTKIKKD